MEKEKDLACRVLRLEQQLESYPKLQTEELDKIRKALSDVKNEILALVASSEEATASGSSSEASMMEMVSAGG